ncbi:hypothetical protein [Streptomyces fragilis]|uniref:Uncharacterized protein n=1 Tax=Streptomyces fragilis TaxID=67301 RepID=A0ABV2YAJ6_9ACTN|nr:hypothetical protein [Streptomyces fragilis]
MKSDAADRPSGPGSFTGPLPEYRSPAQDAWLAERRRVRAQERGRRLRRGVGIGAVVVAGAVVLGVALWPAEGGDSKAAPPGPAHSRSGSAAPAPHSAPPDPNRTVTVPPLHVATPAETPPALTEALRRPHVDMQHSYPNELVRTEHATYRRVDQQNYGARTPLERSVLMTPELSAVVAQGGPCDLQSDALYIDTAGTAQIQVSVITFERPEDAVRVREAAATDPLTYWALPIPSGRMTDVRDPRASAHAQVTTVRSVILAKGQWTDGQRADAALATRTEALLTHVEDAVMGFEDPSGSL